MVKLNNTSLSDPDATQFLLTLRKAYLKSRNNPAEYLTFYVSSTVYDQYVMETEARAQIVLEQPLWLPKYFVKQVRVKEDPMLHMFEVNLSEDRYDWETY